MPPRRSASLLCARGAVLRPFGRRPSFRFDVASPHDALPSALHTADGPRRRRAVCSPNARPSSASPASKIAVALSADNGRRRFAALSSARARGVTLRSTNLLLLLLLLLDDVAVRGTSQTSHDALAHMLMYVHVAHVHLTSATCSAGCARGSWALRFRSSGERSRLDGSACIASHACVLISNFIARRTLRSSISSGVSRASRCIRAVAARSSEFDVSFVRSASAMSVRTRSRIESASIWYSLYVPRGHTMKTIFFFRFTLQQ